MPKLKVTNIGNWFFGELLELLIRKLIGIANDVQEFLTNRLSLYLLSSSSLDVGLYDQLQELNISCCSHIIYFVMEFLAKIGN